MKTKKKEISIWELIWDFKWLILLGIGLILICSLYMNGQIDAEKERSRQTEEYQMALEYLQSQPDIIEKYGEEIPTYAARRYSNYKNDTERYVFTFVYNHVPILNLGDRYDVELNRVDGK